MNACQICLENNSLVTLDCSHQLCRTVYCTKTMIR